MYRKPERWADPANKLFPYQVGFTAPPTGFLRTGTSRQSCNSLIILDNLAILRIPACGYGRESAELRHGRLENPASHRPRLRAV